MLNQAKVLDVCVSTKYRQKPKSVVSLREAPTMNEQTRTETDRERDGADRDTERAGVTWESRIRGVDTCYLHKLIKSMPVASLCCHKSQ